MKRILVIGAKGMLGRDLVPTLGALPDTEVTGWDIEEIDIEKEGATVDKIKTLRPEIIVNLAAYTDVDGCESQQEKALAVNAEGVRHVALGAALVGAKVVHLSTDYLFDGRKGEPYVEEDSPNPLSVYGRSKMRGEAYLGQIAKESLIVRTQWLYGKHGRNFVDAILRQAREKRVLRVVNDQVGSPTYTVDLSKALSSLIRRNEKGVFHVTNSGSCSWHEFGLEIVRVAGIEGIEVLPITSKELHRPAPRPAYSVLSCRRFQEATGMTLRSWAEAVRDYIHSSALGD